MRRFKRPLKQNMSKVERRKKREHVLLAVWYGDVQSIPEMHLRLQEDSVSAMEVVKKCIVRKTKHILQISSIEG